MECNKDEAIRAMKIAENKMMSNDFEGARKFAFKAKKLFPELCNISQLLAVCDVHCSARKKINGAERDLYGILQVESLADEVTIKKQYRKLALVLHPDKNNFPGAEAAFKLIVEANLILSDKGKRYLHDFKCREPSRPMAPKPQNCQGNQNSREQFGAQSKDFKVPSPQFNGVNNQQQSQSNSKGRPSFWTNCPFCKIKYEYYRTLVNKHIRCLKCSKLYIALEIRSQQSATAPHPGNAGTQSAGLGSNTGRPGFFQHEDVRRQGNAKVDGQRDDKVGGSSTIKVEENGNVKTEGQKEGVAFKGSGRNHSVVCGSNGGKVKRHRRPCERPRVSCSKEAGEDFSPKKRSKRTKFSDVECKQKEQVPGCPDKVCDTAEVPAAAELKKDQKAPKTSDLESDENDVVLNGHTKYSSDLEDDSEPVFLDCRDVEFSDFDKDKEEHCFAVDQIWACYDTIDCMPRFYARVRKVYSTGFRLRITWLEANPENHLEIIWAEKGLPVACGKFVLGDTEETRDRLMFSHQIAYAKGSTRFSYAIYPKKGEIWALFKDWNINWSSDPQKHMKYKFEVVEVLTDFDNGNGVLVAYMVKVEGFVSLFQKTSRARLAEHQIPSGELFRFSHRIPAVKLTGMERADVPLGSCELDTASLPDDFDEYLPSNKVKVNPESESCQTSASCPQSPKVKVKLASDSIGIPKKVVKSEGDNDIEQELVEDDYENAAPSTDNNPSCRDGDVIASPNRFTRISELSSPSHGEEARFHDFNVDGQNWEFQVGQIWALRKSYNGNLRCYAQIRKIEASPYRLHVHVLESCTAYNDINRPVLCGLFKGSIGGEQIVTRDSFLYLVKAEVNGKNRFNIYPKEKEIWVLHNKLDAECMFSDLDAGECDIVEVLENDGHMLKVLTLSRVPGHKSVFRAPEMRNTKERVLEIQHDELNRFLCRVRAFLFTEEEYGSLRGSWELDLAEFPGLLSS